MMHVLPILLVALFLYCLIKNIPAYTHFTHGAKSAIELITSIFPYLVAIFIFIEVMKVSGVSDFLVHILAKPLAFFCIPPELTELVILRPFSGSGSLGILKNIYNTYGVDSHISLCASAIVGASDTMFYVISIYLSTTKITKTKYLIPVALISCFLGTISACFFVKLLT